MAARQHGSSTVTDVDHGYAMAPRRAFDDFGSQRQLQRKVFQAPGLRRNTDRRLPIDELLSPSRPFSVTRMSSLTNSGGRPSLTCDGKLKLSSAVVDCTFPSALISAI